MSKHQDALFITACVIVSLCTIVIVLLDEHADWTIRLF